MKKVITAAGDGPVCDRCGADLYQLSSRIRQ